MEEQPFDQNVIPVPYLTTVPVRLLEPIEDLPMVLEPTCRYGHGPLVPQEPSFSMSRLKGGYKREDGERVLVTSRGGFRVTLWRCATCRYLEMFDPD